ncbi:hypothetical protein FQN55_003519 [Onygenales sp. PD_40]|nr:hypothetical protein FQN55_003519 [Onygenales sp. PD_40]
MEALEEAVEAVEASRGVEHCLAGALFGWEELIKAGQVLAVPPHHRRELPGCLLCLIRKS